MRDRRDIALAEKQETEHIANRIPLVPFEVTVRGKASCPLLNINRKRGNRIRRRQVPCPQDTNARLHARR